MNHKHKIRGYTLIEILVVLFIISIVTSVALLSIGRNKNKEVESFTQELVQRMQLAEEQALLQPVVVGVSFNNHSLQFTRYQEKKWQPLSENALSPYRIPKGIQVKIELNTAEGEGEIKKNFPPIIFSTSGDMTPFTIYVGRVGEAPRYAIKGEADGMLTTTALS